MAAAKRARSSGKRAPPLLFPGGDGDERLRPDHRGGGGRAGRGRPYLIADGGNVEVVEVVAEEGRRKRRRREIVRRAGYAAGRVRHLRLGLRHDGDGHRARAQGHLRRRGLPRRARRATRTGWRRSRRRRRPRRWRAAPDSVDAIDGLLDGLRPAIAAYEGSVEVLSVSDSPAVATLRYSGPGLDRRGDRHGGQGQVPRTGGREAGFGLRGKKKNRNLGLKKKTKERKKKKREREREKERYSSFVFPLLICNDSGLTQKQE